MKIFNKVLFTFVVLTTSLVVKGQDYYRGSKYTNQNIENDNSQYVYMGKSSDQLPIKKRTITRTVTATFSKNIPTIAPSSQCSIKILEKGYKCCSPDCKTYYTDEFGNWSYENGEWCGCINEYKSCKNVTGFKCCENTQSVVFTDENGQWGVENNDWCLIV